MFDFCKVKKTCKVLYSEFTDALQFFPYKVGRVGVANPSNRAKKLL